MNAVNILILLWAIKMGLSCDEIATFEECLLKDGCNYFVLKQSGKYSQSGSNFLYVRGTIYTERQCKHANRMLKRIQPVIADGDQKDVAVSQSRPKKYESQPIDTSNDTIPNYGGMKNGTNVTIATRPTTTATKPINTTRPTTTATTPTTTTRPTTTATTSTTTTRPTTIATTPTTTTRQTTTKPNTTITTKRASTKPSTTTTIERASTKPSTNTTTKRASTKPSTTTTTKRASTKPSTTTTTKRTSTKPSFTTTTKRASTKPNTTTTTKRASTKPSTTTTTKRATTKPSTTTTTERASTKPSTTTTTERASTSTTDMPSLTTCEFSNEKLFNKIVLGKDCVEPVESQHDMYLRSLCNLYKLAVRVGEENMGRLEWVYATILNPAALEKNIPACKALVYRRYKCHDNASANATYDVERNQEKEILSSHFENVEQSNECVTKETDKEKLVHRRNE